jgi:hypothetical protein
MINPPPGLWEVWIKPSTLLARFYPSSCGKKQRSALLFSTAAALSIGRLHSFFLVLFLSLSKI